MNNPSITFKKISLAFIFKPIFLFNIGIILWVSACTSIDLDPAPVVDRSDNQFYTIDNNIVNNNNNNNNNNIVNNNNNSYTPSYSIEQPILLPVVRDGKTHSVRQTDTLYSIALEYGLSYRDLAIWNGIIDPNYIQLNQILRLTPPDSVSHQMTGVTIPNTNSIPNTNNNNNSIAYSLPVILQNSNENSPVVYSLPTELPKPIEVSKPIVPVVKNSIPNIQTGDVIWQWPINSRTFSSYTDTKKGIDFSGVMGDEVLAAADGKVVYSGENLKGYGKMLIIKHNDVYLTAYAHNSKLLVKENALVKRGQKIAEMGNTESESIKMHFEIRRSGKPVDPTRLLPTNK
jgi:lipoprotein NlpD